MTYIVGAYWAQREESRIACALRISDFIKKIAQLDSSLAHWFKRAGPRTAQQAELPTDPDGLTPLLKASQRDVGNDVIKELGYSFSAWNGNQSSMGASMSIACGGYSTLVGNSAVLSFAPKSSPTLKLLREILESMVGAFEPDSAIVKSSVRLSAGLSPSANEISPIYSYCINLGFTEAN